MAANEDIEKECYNCRHETDGLACQECTLDPLLTESRVNKFEPKPELIENND